MSYHSCGCCSLFCQSIDFVTALFFSVPNCTTIQATLLTHGCVFPATDSNYKCEMCYQSQRKSLSRLRIILCSLSQEHVSFPAVKCRMEENWGWLKNVLKYVYATQLCFLLCNVLYCLLLHLQILLNVYWYFLSLYLPSKQSVEAHYFHLSNTACTALVSCLKTKFCVQFCIPLYYNCLCLYEIPH